MKKLLFIIFFVFVGFVSAQNTDKATDNPNQTQILQRVYEKTAELLRTKVVSSALPSGAATSSKQDSTITLLNSQLLKLLNISANSDLLIPSTSIKTVSSPATTSTDSVVFGFTSRRITIINDGVATDTLEISNSNLFPSTSTYIRTGGEAMSKNIALQKIYIRKKSGSASNYRLEVE